MARITSGPTMRIPTVKVSNIAVDNSLIHLRVNHSRTGQVAIASTPAHARAGKNGRKIQIASSTNIATRMMRPTSCRDDDCFKRTLDLSVSAKAWYPSVLAFASGELDSLGTLFYEPLWIFHRGSLEGGTLAALRGRKVSIGP